MVQAITAKLNRFETLDRADTEAIENLLSNSRSHSPHHDIIKMGENPDFSLVILEGWAIRYKVVKNGHRQITSFLMPGDFCHLNMLSASSMDHSIAAVSTVTVAYIKSSEAADLFNRHPNVGRAVQVSQFADESRLRALITAIGRQSAEHRIGYSLCDLWARAQAVRLIQDNHLDFPPTQADLADHLGLTSIHVNRMMRVLREQGLVNLKGRCLALPDFLKLARLVGYETTTTAPDRASHSFTARDPVYLRSGRAPTSIKRLSLTKPLRDTKRQSSSG